MGVPGLNILSLASRLIRLQTIGYSRWRANVENDSGVDQPTYYPVVQIQASVQPVTRQMYEQLGLDLAKTYLTVYTATPLQDLQRGQPCDMLDFNGRRWNVESNTNWSSQDGWLGSLVVDIGATP